MKGDAVDRKNSSKVVEKLILMFLILISVKCEVGRKMKIQQFQKAD